jgi:hypothetical protein
LGSDQDQTFDLSGAEPRRRRIEGVSREIGAEFHPLVTLMIPLVTRSWPDPDAAGHDTPRKEK